MKIIITIFRSTSNPFQHEACQTIKSQKIFLNIRSVVVTTYYKFHRCSESMRNSIIHALWTIGVGAGICFGGAKDFCLNFPKLSRKAFVRFLPTIFSHKEHEDLFLVWPPKEDRILCFSANIGRHFLKSNNVGRHSCPDFQGFYPDFQRFCPNFQGFCPNFQQIKNFWDVLAPPAPPPPTPLLLTLDSRPL